MFVLQVRAFSVGVCSLGPSPVSAWTANPSPTPSARSGGCPSRRPRSVVVCLTLQSSCGVRYGSSMRDKDNIPEAADQLGVHNGAGMLHMHMHMHIRSRSQRCGWSSIVGLVSACRPFIPLSVSSACRLLQATVASAERSTTRSLLGTWQLAWTGTTRAAGTGPAPQTACGVCASQGGRGPRATPRPLATLLVSACGCRALVTLALPRCPFRPNYISIRTKVGVARRLPLNRGWTG